MRVNFPANLGHWTLQHFDAFRNQFPTDVASWTREHHRQWQQHAEQYMVECARPSRYAGKGVPEGREICGGCGGSGLRWTYYMPGEYPDAVSCPSCDESGLEPLPDW